MNTFETIEIAGSCETSSVGTTGTFRLLTWAIIEGLLIRRILDVAHARGKAFYRFRNADNAGHTSGQIDRAIQELNKVPQQNTAGCELVSSTSELLSSQGEKLRDTIALFRIDGARHAVESNLDRAGKELKTQVVSLLHPASSKLGAALKRATRTARFGFSFDISHADADETDAEILRAC